MISSSTYPGCRIIVNPEIEIGKNPKTETTNWQFIMKPDWAKKADQKQGPQGFLAATHKSYCLHLPLVLKPDHLLITILSSLALMVRNDPQKFANAVTRLEDVKKMDVKVYSGLDEGIFRNFEIAIGKNFGKHIANEAKCNFTTSCSVTQNVARIALMDIYKPFAEYTALYLCGIPVVHLLGTREDWALLVQKVDHLSKIFQGAGWWFEKLLPVVKEIDSLWEKSSNITWWKSFYNYENHSGSNRASGHINAFFPIIMHEDYFAGWPKYVNNPWFKDTSKKIYLSQFLTMTSEVPFKWIDQTKNPSICHQLNAEGHLHETVEVYGGVMPYCTWRITNENKETKIEGKEAMPTANPPLSTLAVSSSSTLAPSQVRTTQTDTNSKKFVVLPCWHVISLERSTKSDITTCPAIGCGQKVESLEETC